MATATWPRQISTFSSKLPQTEKTCFWTRSDPNPRSTITITIIYNGSASSPPMHTVNIWTASVIWNNVVTQRNVPATTNTRHFGALESADRPIGERGTIPHLPVSRCCTSSVCRRGTRGSRPGPRCTPPEGTVRNLEGRKGKSWKSMTFAGRGGRWRWGETEEGARHCLCFTLAEWILGKFDVFMPRNEETSWRTWTWNGSSCNYAKFRLPRWIRQQ